MKALLFEKPGKANVREIDSPEIGPDEMLIQLKQVGVCHSDFELLAGNYIIPVTFPVIPGHEWAGLVVDTGANVDGFEAGDRVVGECAIGEEHFGFSISGAAAEYFKVRPEWLHKIPDEMTYEVGALVEPFSCAYAATRAADGIDASDSVVVFGVGPIGQCCVAAVKAMGGHVIAAKSLGADETLSPNEDLQEQVRQLTGGRGASVVLEASGNPAAMAAALEVAGQEARIVNIGINIGDKVPAALGLIQSKALQLRGIIGSPNVWPETIRFMTNSGIDLTKMVTASYALNEAIAALDAARDTNSNIKVHIVTD
jgi:L-iditol 2-dehydrogenase